MTDAHCHVSAEVASERELLIGRDFLGIHPWDATTRGVDASVWESLTSALQCDKHIGVGEIGLDRLRERTISPVMRDVFVRQLELAVQLKRPVVLHGAKCWGEVVKTVKEVEARCGTMGAKLFHGFSRSDGLINDIVAMNGFISVGPAIMNEHAVNYRELVKKIPRERLLIETDRDKPGGPNINEVANALARVLDISVNDLEHLTDTNANTFSRL